MLYYYSAVFKSINVFLQIFVYFAEITTSNYLNVTTLATVFVEKYKNIQLRASVYKVRVDKMGEKVYDYTQLAK